MIFPGSLPAEIHRLMVADWSFVPVLSPTDGMLTITMLHDVGRMNVLMRLFPALLRGQPILRQGVTYRTGKEITIETDRPIPAIIDGEVMMSTPLHVAVHEKALNLILTT